MEASCLTRILYEVTKMGTTRVCELDVIDAAWKRGFSIEYDSILYHGVIEKGATNINTVKTNSVISLEKKHFKNQYIVLTDLRNNKMQKIRMSSTVITISFPQLPRLRFF